MFYFLATSSAQSLKNQSSKLQHLRSNREKLLKAMKFDIQWLAGEMNGHGLLSDYEYEDVTNYKSVLNDTDKAEIMLNSLQKKLELNFNHLDKFIEILQLKSRLYGDAINILQGTQISYNLL